MNLHNNPIVFEELINVTSQDMSLLPAIIRRDYYIVLLLKNLANSEFVESVVFKGGTSVSKCYPGVINRFSEDIDLTYIPSPEESSKAIEKMLKRIENAIIQNANYEKIKEERNETNKSMLVWFDMNHVEDSQVKLEIGASVRPEPYSKKTLKSYIHEYLDRNGLSSDISAFDFEEVSLNVLNIERTFIDKMFAVKRHAKCGGLSRKVRHIYDVVHMAKNQEVINFLQNEDRLKEIVRLTKESDYIFMEKRKNLPKYNAQEPYGFRLWKHVFLDDARTNYGRLHESILFSREKQSIEDALRVFESIDALLDKIGE